MCFRGGVETLAPTPGRCKSFPGLLGGPQGKAPMCTSTSVHRALYWGVGGWRGGGITGRGIPRGCLSPTSFLISQTGSLNPCNSEIWDWITRCSVGWMFGSSPGLYPPSQDNQERLQTLLKHLLGGGGQNHPLRTTALECLMLPPDGNRKRSSLRGVCPL